MGKIFYFASTRIVKNFRIKIPLHVMEIFPVAYNKFENTFIFKNWKFCLNFDKDVI